MNPACRLTRAPAVLERRAAAAQTLLAAASAGLGLALFCGAVGVWVQALGSLAALPADEALRLWSRFLG